MNRFGLRDAAPSAKVLKRGPPARAAALAMDFVQTILDAIKAERRRPDSWESSHLKRAIEAIAVGDVNHALELGILSLEDPDKRALSFLHHQDPWFSGEVLQEGLDTVRRKEQGK